MFSEPFVWKSKMKFNRLFATVAGSLSAVSSPCHANAAPILRDGPEIVHCISQAAQGSRWLEKTLWGLRDEEAGWIGAEVANRNGTHDLGVLQINSMWLPRLARVVGRSEAQVRAWLVYDACFNASAARWIFLSSLHQLGDYWGAVGAYHTPTAWRQLRYQHEVAEHLRRRYGAHNK